MVGGSGLARRTRGAYACAMCPASKRSSDRPRPLSGVLKPAGGTLGGLVAEARKLQALEQRLHGLLDPGMARQVRVAGARDGRLTLVTSSAALAARLRMDSASLLRSVSAVCPQDFTDLKVRVAPLPDQVQETRRPRTLPDSARESLERFARDTGDDSLRKRLSKAGRDRED